MKFSIGSGGYDLLWNGASHKLRSKPKRAQNSFFRTILQWKMGPKSTRVHFPLDSFDSAGQSFGDRFPPIKKEMVREGHGLVMTTITLHRFENVYDRSR